MKRGFVAVLMSMMLVFSLGTMAGCSSPKSEEAFIRENLSAQLDRIKDAEADTVAELVASMESGVSPSDMATLKQMGLTSEDIVRALIKDYDYTIDDITVNGNEALAKVTVKARGFGDFTTDLTEVVQGIMTDPSQIAGMSESEVLTMLGEKVKDMLADLPIHESTVTVDIEKNGNTWSVTNKGLNALGSVFLM